MNFEDTQKTQNALPDAWTAARKLEREVISEIYDHGFRYDPYRYEFYRITPKTKRREVWELGTIIEGLELDYRKIWDNHQLLTQSPQMTSAAVIEARLQKTTPFNIISGLAFVKIWAKDIEIENINDMPHPARFIRTCYNELRAVKMIRPSKATTKVVLEGWSIRPDEEVIKLKRGSEYDTSD